MISRRHFLKTSLSSASLLAFGNALAKPNLPIRQTALIPGRFLDLPPGFSDFLIDQSGSTLSDGYITPARPDGMACFTDRLGRLILMRNHEEFFGPVQAGQEEFAYDTETGGGVTRLVLNNQFEKISSNYVLTGTMVNCAGGKSPWGWLSCEEAFYETHGYVFLCDIEAEGLQKYRKISAYGRFAHEAAAVDEQSLIAYLTEDQSDSCFYRFVPESKQTPFEGKLQALKVVGQRNFNPDQLSVGDQLKVEWVNIDDPTPNEDNVRLQGKAKGAMLVRRGEGLWVENGLVYFSATTGGSAQKGQVFCYQPTDAENGELKLIGQGEESSLNYPDNITVGPSNSLFVCEDNGRENHIRVICPDGRSLKFARNSISQSEFAGVCFDPSGNCMFVNIQEEGLTIGVRGPFKQWLKA